MSGIYHCIFRKGQYLVLQTRHKLIQITAREIRTGFERIGSVTTGNDTMQKLYQAVMASYSGNFVGIPTDCPHREKNGWTGDAQLACETGLWLYDGAKNYEHYLNQLRFYKYAYEKYTGNKVSQVGIIYVENHTKSVFKELCSSDMEYIENKIKEVDFTLLNH